MRNDNYNFSKINAGNFTDFLTEDKDSLKFYSQLALRDFSQVYLVFKKSLFLRDKDFVGFVNRLDNKWMFIPYLLFSMFVALIFTFLFSSFVPPLAFIVLALAIFVLLLFRNHLLLKKVDPLRNLETKFSSKSKDSILNILCVFEVLLNNDYINDFYTKDEKKMILSSVFNAWMDDKEYIMRSEYSKILSKYKDLKDVADLKFEKSRLSLIDVTEMQRDEFIDRLGECYFTLLSQSLLLHKNRPILIDYEDLQEARPYKSALNTLLLNTEISLDAYNSFTSVLLKNRMTIFFNPFESLNVDIEDKSEYGVLNTLSFFSLILNSSFAQDIYSFDERKDILKSVCLFALIGNKKEIYSQLALILKKINEKAH